MLLQHAVHLCAFLLCFRQYSQSFFTHPPPSPVYNSILSDVSMWGVVSLGRNVAFSCYRHKAVQVAGEFSL